MASLATYRNQQKRGTRFLAISANRMPLHWPLSEIGERFTGKLMKIGVSPTGQGQKCEGCIHWKLGDVSLATSQYSNCFLASQQLRLSAVSLATNRNVEHLTGHQQKWGAMSQATEENGGLLHCY